MSVLSVECGESSDRTGHLTDITATCGQTVTGRNQTSICRGSGPRRHSEQILLLNSRKPFKPPTRRDDKCVVLIAAQGDPATDTEASGGVSAPGQAGAALGRPGVSA